MKISLVAYVNNAAGGAGNYAMTFISQNGAVISSTSYTIPRQMSISRMAFVSTVGVQGIVTRSTHPADWLAIPPLSDTGADYEQALDFEQMFGHGVACDSSEVLSLVAQLSGNGTAFMFIELDEALPGRNMRINRVQGVNAAVAGVPTETGGSVAAYLSPIGLYRLRGVYFHSTTALKVAIGMKNGELTDFNAHTALLIGHKMAVVASRQFDILTGKGSEWSSGLRVFLTATAADAANTQFGFYCWEVMG